MKITIDKEFALTQAISAKAKNLYLILLTYAYDQASCFPTIATLSKDLGGKDRNTINLMNELKEIGLVKVYRPDTAIKSNNRYILMPTEWVDYETKYDKATYTLTLDEFEELKAKIIAFYEENGIEDLHPELVEGGLDADKPAKAKTKGKSLLEAQYEVLQDKLNKDPNYKYNATDCVVVFAKYLKDTKGQQCKVNGRENKRIMKEKLVGLNNADIDLFIKTYIDMYDTNFKSPKYSTISISSLDHDWIFNKVLVRADAIKSTTATTKQELQLSGVKFAF